MKYFYQLLSVLLIILSVIACQQQNKNLVHKEKSAKEILSDTTHLAMAYGGYRENTRDIQPSIEEIKEDLKILAAMKVNIIRTYNVQLPHAQNILKAISELKTLNPDFEMYMMLGAWIDCKDAWTENPDHDDESEQNKAEIEKAVSLAKQYPDIVKIISVGNEAMVKWAASYHVQPDIILKWVKYLQSLKQKGKLPKDLWITTSDNYAAWGGQLLYRNNDLEALIKAVDYISLHTYPMHETHYFPYFWGYEAKDSLLEKEAKIDLAMESAMKHAIQQYDSVVNYMKSLGVDKPVHIGETGWASLSNGQYGPDGTRATDEFKQGLFYKKMSAWTKENNIAFFYFEAFDEHWKDDKNELGSENNFGLFTMDGQVKYALWNIMDTGVFDHLYRNGNKIKKTYQGDKAVLLEEVLLPPVKPQK